MGRSYLRDLGHIRVNSVVNTNADSDSRQEGDPFDRKLGPRVLQKICLVLGKSETELPRQLPKYIAWRPDLFSCEAQTALHLIARARPETYFKLQIGLEKVSWLV